MHRQGCAKKNASSGAPSRNRSLCNVNNKTGFTDRRNARRKPFGAIALFSQRLTLLFNAKSKSPEKKITTWCPPQKLAEISPKTKKISEYTSHFHYLWYENSPDALKHHTRNFVSGCFLMHHAATRGPLGVVSLFGQFAQESKRTRTAKRTKLQ